jgi:hypothetical protein
MAGAVFGLDFGTTNSLLTLIVNGRPVHLVDEKDRPHPSVIWYRGSDVVVGRKARDNLDAGSEAVAGSFVRSPKRLLDDDAPISVGGRGLDPRDVIGEVLKFLRHEAEQTEVTKAVPDRVVMTIPVKLDGASRRRLREAARLAGIAVVQFVHEPLAALYAYLRSQRDYRKSLAELDGCRVLVFDWGGGTLDLTLCQVQRDQIVQIDNLGDNDVGGDRFDEIIRNRVRDAHAQQHGIDDLVPLERDDARISLLNQCEIAKIDLSGKDVATIFRRNYLRHDSPARDLSVKVTRDDLATWTRELVDRGLGAIDLLLERNQLSYQQVALCLPTGGMVNMPAVRDGLTERFGGRARRISNGDRIISEGAAWIAHDNLRLGLAKPIELLQSDASYAAVVPLPYELPIENQFKQAADSVYRCVDPRSGRATFTFARPSRPKPRDARSDRKTYTTLHLGVDEAAEPLMERLQLRIDIDHDYVAHVEVHSTMRKDTVKAEIFDLEFTLRFPDAPGSLAVPHKETDSKESRDTEGTGVATHSEGAVRLQSNISERDDWQDVPGELVERFRPGWFDERARQYSEWQYRERVYHKICPFCRRTRYDYKVTGCRERNCLWRRAYPTPANAQWTINF